MADEIVTKAEFAKLLKRDPAFVSRAIASGRLCGSALVGEGRSARIRVAPAMEQLGRSLDLSQQLAQANPILPGAAPASAGVLEFRELQPHGGALKRSKAQPGVEGEADAGERDAIHGLREESLGLKNRRARMELERLEREQLKACGELVPAADVTAALRRQLQPLIATFDEVPAVLAKTLSEQFGVNYAEVLIAVKAGLRQQRSAWAERARAMGETMEVEA